MHDIQGLFLKTKAHNDHLYSEISNLRSLIEQLKIDLKIKEQIIVLLFNNGKDLIENFEETVLKTKLHSQQLLMLKSILQLNMAQFTNDS